ncbi:MAG TPA: cupredoxin family copper-binding protein [Steroidobacteraceae bacterium]|nr:cupredoxin family copper-binding protein [Steroidobacteraceae bacterium]
MSVLASLARRGWHVALLLVVCAVALALGLAQESRAAAPVTIEIDQFQFMPREITVEPGTVVQWMNRDQAVHNVIAPGVQLASPGMDTGDHFAFTFTQPGDYDYLCGLHPHMTGIVHVRAAGNSG